MDFSFLNHKVVSSVGFSFVLGLLAICVSSVLTAKPAAPKVDAPSETIALWPGVAPGEKGDIGEEKDTTPPEPKVSPEQYIIRLGNVTKPTIAVYRAPKEKDTGAAILLCPGGGYNILAMNLEGTEVCKWLNSLGVTAFLLKYRVPGRMGLERYTAALQDSQRALGIIRHRAKEWGVDPKRLGILGFSAGGHLSATTCASTETRTYPAVDEADKVSCRPDFTVLIYPAYLTAKDDLTQLAPEVKVTANTPPTFIAMTQDDPVKVECAFVYAQALHKAKIPVELHIYPVGGHGYGLRPSKNAVSHWPERVAEWLNTQGWLKTRS